MDRQRLHGAVVFIHILLSLGLGLAHRGCPEVTADLAATTWELLIRLEIDSAVLREKVSTLAFLISAL